MTHRLTEELQRLSFESHGKCVSCGYTFNEGDISHLGYGTDDKPLYVCDKCSCQLKETALRYYFQSFPYEIPGRKNKLWRYMDFTKYVSMLSTGGLYFARADTLDDIFEGAKGVKANKEEWDDHYLQFFREAIKNPPVSYECKYSDEEVEQQAKRLLEDLELGGQFSRKHTFINCWHENEHESEAMWRLYSSYLENAIAVRTSYDSLYHSLGRNPSISIGRVVYIDLRKGYTNINNSFWRKRKSFAHEKEVRAIVVDRECSDTGKTIDCDLSLLLEEVFLSPSAPGWFKSLVKDVNKKFDIDVCVSTSGLIEEPFF